MSHRSLIVLPDDGIQTLLTAIKEAKDCLRIKMFIFTEPQLLQAVIAAAKKGLRVKVMLNRNRSNGDEPNEATWKVLEEGGVEVKDSNPLFKVTHEKSMVVDERVAFIQSLNWSARHLTDTRDYAITTTHAKEVREMMDCFECDWDRVAFNPGETAHLLWSPANGRARMAHFIDSAKHSLFIQNDRYQDLVIIERLMRAAHRGVKVHIMSPPPHSLKKEKIVEGVGGLKVLHDIGIKVHNIKNLSLHAKMLLADEHRAIIGSTNLTTGSFDERRELAIEVDDHPLIHRLTSVVHHDWHHSHPLDLSDKGLYEDLENRGGGGSEKLILDYNAKKD